MGTRLVHIGGSDLGDSIWEELYTEVVKPAVKEVTPDLIASGKQISKQLGVQYGKQLRDKGKGWAEDIVWTATKPLPPYVRRYLSPTYKEKPSKIPAWANDMIDPLIKPIIAGAKEVAAQKAEKMKAPLYTFLTAVGVTIFLIGFGVGRKV